MKKKVVFSLLLLAAVGYWYFPQNLSYLQIPVRFFLFSDKPLVQVEIEGKTLSLMIDLGSYHNITLKKSVLKKIENKIELEPSVSIDMRGNQYLCPTFRIPQMKLRNLQVFDIAATEQNEDFLTRGSKLWPDQNHIVTRFLNMLNLKFIDGSIGWTMLRKGCCFFDFPHSLFMIGKDQSQVSKEMGISFEQFLEIPFQVEKSGVVLEMETDLGSKRLLLDTGANLSVLRTSQVGSQTEEVEPGKLRYISNHLRAGSHDFGKWEFWLFEIADSMNDFDGALGIDFFKQHRICLDFEKKIAYVSPSRGGDAPHTH